MSRRKRQPILATPLLQGFSPLGFWIIERIKGTSMSIPMVAHGVGMSYPYLSSIIYGKLLIPMDLPRKLVEFFGCEEEYPKLLQLMFGFKTRRSTSAFNRRKQSS